jgi:hypothetical protein
MVTSETASVRRASTRVHMPLGFYLLRHFAAAATLPFYPSSSALSSPFSFASLSPSRCPACLLENRTHHRPHVAPPFPFPPSCSRWSKCLGAIVPFRQIAQDCSILPAMDCFGSIYTDTSSSTFSTVTSLLLIPFQVSSAPHPCLSTMRLLPERCPLSYFISRYSPLLLIYRLLTWTSTTCQLP